MPRLARAPPIGREVGDLVLVHACIREVHPGGRFTLAVLAHEHEIGASYSLIRVPGSEIALPVVARPR